MQLKGKDAAVGFYNGVSATDFLIEEAHSHELSMAPDKVDGTRFLDTFKSEVPIFVTWSGSFESYFDPTDNSFMILEQAAREGKKLSEIDAAHEIRLWITDTYYYGGDSTIEMSITSSKDDLVKASVTISGAGELTKNTTGTRPTAIDPVV